MEAHDSSLAGYFRLRNIDGSLPTSFSHFKCLSRPHSSRFPFSLLTVCRGSARLPDCPSLGCVCSVSNSAGRRELRMSREMVERGDAELARLAKGASEAIRKEK